MDDKPKFQEECSPQSDDDGHPMSVSQYSHSGRRGSSYRSYKFPNTFSRAFLIQPALGGIETFTRSLFATGNGYPQWDPPGIDSPRSKKHRHQGVGIGDVGLMDRVGYFVYLFNIFADRDDPLNELGVPEDFERLPLDANTDILSQPDYFSAGTVIASKGVNVTRVSEDPLCNIAVKLATSAREAAVLLLKDGATREDLILTSHLTKYIEKYALSWHYYMFSKAAYSGSMVPNGSLYLITGCDKAPSFSNVSIPSQPRFSGDRFELQYSEDRWVNLSRCRQYTIQKEQEHAEGRSFATFIRGIRIALNDRVWAEHLPYEPPEGTAYYQLLSTPILGWRAKLTKWKELHFGRGKKYLPDRERVPFHPSILITHILLEQCPDADVAIVEDSVWCNVVDRVNGDGTAAQIIQLVARAVSSCEIVMVGHTVMLAQRAKNTPQARSSLLDRLLRRDTYSYSWAIRKTNKILGMR